MATWTEVVTYLKSNYEVEQVSEELLRLVFGIGDDRSQMLFVMGLNLDDPDEALVTFSSPFARVDQLSPKSVVDAMNDNFIGISQFGDWYVMKHIAPMANLDANEIEWPITNVTLAADALEEKLGLGDDF